MAKNSFLKEAMTENHPQYEKAIQRKEPLYQRENDLKIGRASCRERV